MFITIFHMGVTGLVTSILLARMLGMAASLIYIIKFNRTIYLQVKSFLHFDFSGV